MPLRVTGNADQMEGFLQEITSMHVSAEGGGTTIEDSEHEGIGGQGGAVVNAAAIKKEDDGVGTDEVKTERSSVVDIDKERVTQLQTELYEEYVTEEASRQAKR